MANLLDDLGERDEARALYTEVIAGYTEQLGPSHADTLRAKLNLAVLLQTVGERDEARALFQQCATGYGEADG